jgi:chaperonin cofactor prefoldin
MTLDEIKSQWEKDCEIDDIELDKSSLEIPKLHAKYQDLLSSKILVMKQYQYKYDTLLKDKWLWYNGKMSQEQIKELGWSDDPLDGLKIMKTDLQIFYNSDKDIQELNAKIEYLKVTIDYLKECMQNITWRHQTIKNTIDWRKFMAGS